MKPRLTCLIPQIAEPENLRLAFWKAGKGKRHTPAALDFGANLDANVACLREQILNEKIEVGDYHYFKIFEPKERQICASAFREQVLHHALMNICHARFEQAQVFDSYASRPGKGVHAALARAKKFTRHHAWFLKLDVRKFFDSIHHAVLKNQLDRLFKDVPLLILFGKIIDSYSASPPLLLERPPGDEVKRGLPIGNLTSQYFANHYLAGLDVFIKQTLGIRAYVRYMDDLVLWSDDKFLLKNAHAEIATFVREKLRCELKPELLNRTELGLPFLGYRIFPETMRLTHQSQQRFIRKMKIIDAHLEAGRWDEATAQRHALPLLAFARKADTLKMRQKLFDLT